MKKQNLKSLQLKKEFITKLASENLKGGHGCPTEHSCYCNYTKYGNAGNCAI